MLNASLDSTNFSLSRGLGANYILSSGSGNSGSFQAGQYNFSPSNSGVVPLTIYGASGQSSDLLDFDSSSSSVLAKIDANGNGTMNTVSSQGNIFAGLNGSGEYAQTENSYTSRMFINPYGIEGWENYGTSTYYPLLNLNTGQVLANTLFVGTANTASQAQLSYGMNAGGFTSAAIGTNNSGSVAGVTPEAFLLTDNPAGYGLLGIDHLGTAGIRNNLDVGGSASITSTLQSGSHTITGNLSVSGTSTLTGNATFTGNAAVGGTLGVTGTSTLGVVNAYNVIASNLTAIGLIQAQVGLESQVGATYGYTPPAYFCSGNCSSGASTSANFHTVLLEGTTGSSGSTCGPSGGTETTNCATVTLPSGLAFTTLGTYACGPVNEVISSGTPYQRLKSPADPTFPSSADGKTFYLNSTNTSAAVSAVCTGY
jgi:hypothetical protein